MVDWRSHSGTCFMPLSLPTSDLHKPASPNFVHSSFMQTLVHSPTAVNLPGPYPLPFKTPT